MSGTWRPLRGATEPELRLQYIRPHLYAIEQTTRGGMPTTDVLEHYDCRQDAIDALRHAGYVRTRHEDATGELWVRKREETSDAA